MKLKEKLTEKLETSSNNNCGSTPQYSAERLRELAPLGEGENGDSKKDQEDGEKMEVEKEGGNDDTEVRVKPKNIIAHQLGEGFVNSFLQTPSKTVLKISSPIRCVRLYTLV